MPVYSYKCKKCGVLADKINTIDNRKQGPECCGEIMTQYYGNYHVVPDFEPYIDYNLSEKPVYVKSKQHRKQIMKERGISEKYGKNWI